MRPARPVFPIGFVVDATPVPLATTAPHHLAGLVAQAFAAGAHRAELLVDLLDTDSADLALELGFGYEGRRRAAGTVDGIPHDLAAFVRTADDPGTPIAPAFPPVGPGDLTDGVVELREASPDDLEAVLETDSDELTVAVGFGGVPSRDEAAAMLARAPLERRTGPGVLFAIVDVATGRCAGTIRLRRNGPPQVAMLGYAVHPGFRGRRYTTRALVLVARWAFAVTDLMRLELGAKQHNLASQRAALAAGFVPEGLMPGRLRNPDGTFSDEARFYLLRS